MAVKVYDYSSDVGTDRWAYTNATMIPVPPAGTIFTAGYYTQVSVSDNSWVTTPWLGVMAYLYKIQIPGGAVVSKIEWLHEGHSYGESIDYPMQIWIYNDTDSAWEKLDEVVAVSDVTRSGEITINIEDYIDGSGYIWFETNCWWGALSMMVGLYQDYVKFTLTYPVEGETNMKINIGDVWKEVDSMKINIGDVWKDVEEIKQNIGNTWKTVF